MPTIRLLTSVHGDDSPVVGDSGDLLEVTDEIADVWADGERAELLVIAAAPAVVDPVNLVKPVPVAPAPAVEREPRRPRARTRQPR